MMHDRPALLVRLENQDGVFGWGEVWCNFPSMGAEHRAHLLDSLVAPILREQVWADPPAAFRELSRRLHVLAIQSGELGPMAQIVAGVDVALWDLAARRAAQPLWQMLDGAPTIPVYASGLNPTRPEQLAAVKLQEGHRAFKLKVGFGEERDRANVEALRALLGPLPLMLDANQAWDPGQARAMSAALAEYAPLWLEEPIAADQPLSVWQQLARNSKIPLAAGENLRGIETFAAAIGASALGVIQPDLGKWGGFSGCLEVGRMARAQGVMFCPHWLGGGVGLAASLHLKAAVGGPGYVEVDANPNPLRELGVIPAFKVDDGNIELDHIPGLGVIPNLAAIERYRVQ
ncbi:MAG: mandelate racemase/muconate lactonizing enzyme family protein [Burkholderiales bacterium]|nr:mandelate racemase/muconate lactonizing enzyme family protein [Burkholderiales bacterium]